MSTNKWAVDFSDYLNDSRRSHNTVAAYLSDLGRFHDWFEAVNGPLSPNRITSFDLGDYRKYSLEQERVKPATWNRRRAMLTVLIAWSQTQGYLEHDPLENVEKAREVEPPPRWLTEPEYRRLMRHLEQQVNTAPSDYQCAMGKRDRAIASLMIYAGLRVGEVTALEIGDIEISERKGQVVVRSGKGDKRRTVPLNKKARQAVMAWLDAWNGDPGVLFPNKGGKSLGSDGVQGKLAHYGLVLQIDNLTPHSLRHTFAKRLLDSGVPLNWVSKLLGHARLETTARYTQAGQSDYENAVESL